VIALVATAFAGITVEAPPRAGKETVVVVQDEQGNPRGGQTIRVVHRPNLPGEQELAVGITDGRGRIRWTPRSAGVAWVRAPDDHLPVRVAGPLPVSVPLLTIALLASGVAALARGVVWRR
jgi:hypothetical protein